MSNGKKAIFITIITTVLADVIGSIIISMIAEVNFIEATVKLWNWIYNIFKIILFFKIPVWIILFLILFFIIILNLIYKYSNENNQLKPWYNDYTKDTYKNVLYTWNYSTYSGKIEIKNFRPICKNCDGDLTVVHQHGNMHYGSPRLYCPNCDNVLITPDSEEANQAKLFVYNNLKKKLKDLEKGDGKK